MSNGCDPLDLASEREEFFRNNAMRLRKPEGPAATGTCLYCHEAVSGEKRWCDADHRDAYERAHRGGRR